MRFVEKDDIDRTIWTVNKSPSKKAMAFTCDLCSCVSLSLPAVHSILDLVVMDVAGRVPSTVFFLSVKA
jgi:hypothetical protein